MRCQYRKSRHSRPEGAERASRRPRQGALWAALPAARRRRERRSGPACAPALPLPWGGRGLPPVGDPRRPAAVGAKAGGGRGADRSEEAPLGAMSAPAGLPPRPAGAAAVYPGGPGAAREAAAAQGAAPRYQNGEGPAACAGLALEPGPGEPGAHCAAPSVTPRGSGGLLGSGGRCGAPRRPLWRVPGEKGRPLMNPFLWKSGIRIRLGKALRAG